MRGVFGVSEISLLVRSVHREIGTIDLKHLNLVIAKRAGGIPAQTTSAGVQNAILDRVPLR
jgi:hypothetical protein